MNSAGESIHMNYALYKPHKLHRNTRIQGLSRGQHAERTIIELRRQGPFLLTTKFGPAEVLNAFEKYGIGPSQRV